MNIIKNDNDYKDQISKITKLIKVFEKISNNYIHKFKFIFLDTLLNEWYTVDKNILKDKIDDFDDMHSLFIYNSYKYFIYILSYILRKHKISYDYIFMQFLYKISHKKKQLISIIKNEQYKNIIKNQEINIIKMKINKYELNKEIHFEISLLIDDDIKLFNRNIRKIFIYNLIGNNIQMLKKEKIGLNYNILRMNNKDNINNALIQMYYNKWIVNSLNDIYKLFIVFTKKIKFCQCNNIIQIYKRKLRFVYKIFINNYNEFYSSHLNLRERKIKNKLRALSIIYPLNKIIISRNINSYSYYILFYYSISKNILLIYIVFIFINKYIARYKNNFMINIKNIYNKKQRYFHKIEYKIKYLLFVISNIISFHKYKIVSNAFNSIKFLMSKGAANKLNKYNIKNKKIIGKAGNKRELLNIILLYDKYHNFKLKFSHKLFKYFIKWKILYKKCIFQEMMNHTNIIKKKIKNYDEKNNALKVKLLQIKKLYRKKKKNKSNSHKNNNEKITKQNNIKKKCTKKDKNIKGKLMEKIMISDNKPIDSKEFDDYFDNIQITYLDNLENLKNKNEPIIANLQSEINNLINDIEILSNEI